MDAGRVYRFPYPLRSKNKRATQLPKLRDGDAFIEIFPVLASRGYEFGGTLLNLSARNQRDECRAFIEQVRPSDLIVVTTRLGCGVNGSRVPRRTCSRNDSASPRESTWNRRSWA